MVEACIVTVPGYYEQLTSTHVFTHVNVSGRESKLWGTSKNCFLSQSDSSLAVGWLHRANIDQNSNPPLFSATQKFTHIILTINVCIYSQHIPGVSNVIADALSCRFDLDDNSLTCLINSYPHLQVQGSFRLCPIHPDINSWMTFRMQKCKGTKELQRILKTKSVGCGEGVLNTHIQLDSHTMCGYPTYNLTNEPMLSERLQLPYGEENFLAQTKNALLHQQSKRPWQNWVRSLGQTWGTTPCMEQDHSSILYLPDSSRGCKT